MTDEHTDDDWEVSLTNGLTRRRVADSDAWSLSDFDAGVGETVTREMAVGVRLTVLDGESVQAEDSAEQTATVEVSNPQQGTASVGLQASFSNAEA